MEDIINKIYPGKILLFGEYTVLHDSNSLAIPLYNKTANWDYDDLEFESRESLDQFIDYLVLLGAAEFDIDGFSKEWEEGLFLESTIPNGYGAGSSGAVVAALYDCFVKNKTNDLKELRIIFQQMEAHFHGTSSGLDPLVSYTGQGIIIEDNTINIQNVEENTLLDNLYLWDSGVSRKTGPLVTWYKDQLKSISFKNLVHGNLIPLNNSLITSFIEEENSIFIDKLKELEDFQFQYFKKMFPAEIKRELKKLKEKYSATVKLCGAGGGGFYLFYSDDDEISDSHIIPLRF